jgi:hypothetical protein
VPQLYDPPASGLSTVNIIEITVPFVVCINILLNLKENSYLRDREAFFLLRLYSDVTELALGLELAALNRLAAVLMPVDSLTEVLQKITVHLPPGINFLRPVKSEFIYVLFHHTSARPFVGISTVPW